MHDIMNPFYAEILKSIETELDKTRQTFILSNHYDSTEKQREFLETLMQLGADGGDHVAGHWHASRRHPVV